MKEAWDFAYTVFIGKPSREVWNALITPSTVSQYYMAPLRCLELRPGGKVSYGSAGDLICGVILEVDPPARLVHTFRFADSEDPETVVTYCLEPQGDAMCGLQITQGGFNEKNQTYDNIAYGWPVIVSSLKTLLETGHALPWPQAAISPAS